MAHRNRGRRRLGLLLAAAPVIGLAVERASAQVYNWTFNGSGNWSVAGHWSPAGPPPAGSAALIDHADAINRTITFDFNYATPLSTLTLNQSSIGASTLSMSANRLGTSGTAIIGNSGKGVLDQAGGTFTVGADLLVGVGSFSDGTVSVSKPSSSLEVTGDVRLGLSGRGSLILSDGGSMSVGGSLRIAEASGAVGTFSMGGGGTATLNVTGSTIVGTDGALLSNGLASFFQSAGIHSAGTLAVGSMFGASASYSMSGGTISATTLIRVQAGGGGSDFATFSQQQGVVTAPIVQVSSSGGTGWYNLDGGTLSTNLISLNNLSTTDQAALFTQTSSARVTAGSISVSGPSVYFVQGAAAVLGADRIVVGETGTGALMRLQTGMINVGTSGLTVGGGLSSEGTFRLAGGTLNVAGNTQVGSFGSGVFQHTFGWHTITGSLILGRGNGGPGVYELSSGTLSVPTIEITPKGTFTANAGTILPTTIINNGSIFVQPGFSVSTFTNGVGAKATLNGLVTVNTLMTNAGAPVAGTGVLQIAAAASFSGSGQIGPSVTSFGTINAVGGDLVLNDAFFSNTGTLRASPASHLFIHAANVGHTGTIIIGAGGGIIFSNSSIINQTGRGISMSGGLLAVPLLTNAPGGTFSGFGQIAGDLINHGSMTFIGASQIVGNLTNNATGHIVVRNDKLLVTGAGVNNGTIETVSGGTIVFDGGLSATPLPAAAGSVAVSPGTSAVASFIRQQTLQIEGTMSETGSAILRPSTFGGQTSLVQSLGIDGSTGNWLGRLDLADNDLIIDHSGASPLATIKDQILTAFNGGTWDGHGITSSLANAATFALGYGDNAELAYSSFGGLAIDSDSVLIKYTYYGDANLDGEVDLRDLYLLSLGWLASGLWTDGDFNYDGMVDKADLTLLAKNWQAGNGAPLGAALEELGLPAVSVPEPGGILGLLLGTWSLFGRAYNGLKRRRRLKHV